MKYVQCQLKKEGEDFSSFCTYWIPQFGINKVKVEVGKIVELEENDWWEIVSVSKPRDGFKVKERERGYKKFQNSLPNKGIKK